MDHVDAPPPHLSRIVIAQSEQAKTRTTATMRSFVVLGTSSSTSLLLVVAVAALPSASGFTLLRTAQLHAAPSLFVGARPSRRDDAVRVLVSSESSSSSSSSSSTPFDEATSTASTSIGVEEEPVVLTAYHTSYDPSDAASHKDMAAGLDDLLNQQQEHEDKEVEIIQTTASSSKEEPESSFSGVQDILSDLDGNPLSPAYFAQAMGLDNVESYTCPEQDKAFRGFMSKGCRVQLHPTEQTAFYKQVSFAHLAHAREKLKTAPHKLLRDIKSYQVVAAFLQSAACQMLQDDDRRLLVIPKCYHAELEPNLTHPMDSKFSFVLQDLNPNEGWYQTWLLDSDTECKAALGTCYARMHAFFWHGSDFWKNHAEAGEELEAAVWPCGSYVQPVAQGWPQCHQVATEWIKKRKRFERELSSFDYWDNLGERLESVAVHCGKLAHPFADEDEEGSSTMLSKDYQQYRTFTHGDPKQANLLFRQTRRTPSSYSNNNNKEEELQQLQVGVIDFQWAGFGLAATDIAHFITSAVHADMLVDGGEKKLLRYYYDKLVQNLVEFGVHRTVAEAQRKYSYETVFMEQYEIAVLDICRLMIAYTWDRFEEPVTADDAAACARTMNKTSYNKSIPNIVWLLGRCDEILKSRGV